MAGVISAEVSTVRPRFSARGRRVSVASSAMRERSTCSGVKDRWSARLSWSSASVRPIARELTAWRRSTSSPFPRLGSLRATSSSVCVTASGVRSSWEALAANRWCSATCASSRASMVSKASASSRNSSLRPSLDSVGEGSLRGYACGVCDARQGGKHASGEKPSSQQTEYQQERHHDGCDRSEISQEVAVALHDEDHPRVHTTGKGEISGGEEHDAGEHEERGVAEREFETNAQAGRSIHRLLRYRRGSRRRARWR